MVLCYKKEGRRIEDVDKVILQQILDDEYAPEIYEILKPKSEMGINICENMIKGLAREMSSSKEIRQTIASLVSKRYLQKEGLYWG